MAIDKFDLIRDQLVELLEQGRRPWACPWAAQPLSNLVTNHIYSGQNPLLLTIALWSKGRSTDLPWFCSFNQAKQKGWAPKKGSKACWVRYSGVVDTDPDRADTDVTETLKRFLKWYAVFHVEDLEGEGLDEYVEQKRQDTHPGTVARNEELDVFFEKLPVPVSYEGDSAFYSPSSDRITLPPIETFFSQEGFYGTLAHEHGHSTGHPSRLNRFGTAALQGKKDYAFEELIAEITAAYVMGTFGWVAEIEHHAAYLASWISLLKTDSNAFFRAEAEARKATRWLMEQGGVPVERALVEAA